MYIKELFESNKPVISFETFPPKQNANFDLVMNSIDEIAELKPDYISVTYGAGGGTSKNTVKIASKIENELNITALAHLTCVSSTKAEILEILSKLKANNINNILALRGDIPKDSDFPNPLNYKFAFQLIEDIKKFGDFCIGAACYPEGHFECKNIEDDINYLKLKIESGVDFLVSQLFFDNNKMYEFLNRLEAKNIKTKVQAGIMPITNHKQITRMIELSSASMPPEFKQMLDKYQDDISLKEAGIEYASNQIYELINCGIAGIHIYTMNKPDVALKIMNNINH